MCWWFWKISALWVLPFPWANGLFRPHTTFHTRFAAVSLSIVCIFMFIFFITHTLASHLNISLLLISGFHFMALDQPHYWQQSGCQTHRQYMNMVLKRYFIWTAGLSSLYSHCQRPVQNTQECTTYFLYNYELPLLSINVVTFISLETNMKLVCFITTDKMAAIHIPLHTSVACPLFFYIILNKRQWCKLSPHNKTLLEHRALYYTSESIVTATRLQQNLPPKDVLTGHHTDGLLKGTMVEDPKAIWLPCYNTQAYSGCNFKVTVGHRGLNWECSHAQYDRNILKSRHFLLELLRKKTNYYAIYFFSNNM